MPKLHKRKTIKKSTKSKNSKKSMKSRNRKSKSSNGKNMRGGAAGAASGLTQMAISREQEKAAAAEKERKRKAIEQRKVELNKEYEQEENARYKEANVALENSQRRARQLALQNRVITMAQQAVSSNTGYPVRPKLRTPSIFSNQSNGSGITASFVNEEYPH